jgi:hypothetical protein
MTVIGVGGVIVVAAVCVGPTAVGFNRFRAVHQCEKSAEGACNAESADSLKPRLMQVELLLTRFGTPMKK